MRRMFSEKQLNKKYVKIIPAPESTTLTDDQIAQITSGVHVEGSFLGYTNPVFFPSILDPNNYVGMMLIGSVGLSYIRGYSINASTKVITLSGDAQKQIYLRNIADINGKSLPANPSNTGTFTLKMVDGILAWVKDI